MNKYDMEDYETFFKKQCLPKNLRNVDVKVLQMNTRTNAMNISSKMIETIEISEEQRKMIKLKYELKKIETHLQSEKKQIRRFQKKSRFRNRKFRRVNEPKNVHDTFSPVPQSKGLDATFVDNPKFPKSKTLLNRRLGLTVYRI